MRYVNETRSLAIEAFRISHGETDVVRADIADVAQLTKASPDYIVRAFGENLQPQPMAFSGLFPQLSYFHGVMRSQLSNIMELFRTALPQPSYLGPFRAEPGTLTRSPGQVVQTLGPRGERSIEMLADDKLRHNGSVGDAVSQWFTDTLGQRIAIDTNSSRPQLLVTDHAGSMDVSLADTGAGFAQVLPICVQNFAYRAGRIKTPMLIVEQPELHLHPAAHGNVADLFVETAMPGQNWRSPTCIVETHSEQLIMRIRRRIAEGFEPERVVLWSLNHRDSFEEKEATPVRVIAFDTDGSPQAWPAGVFEETLRDLSGLRHAARERGL